MKAHVNVKNHLIEIQHSKQRDNNALVNTQSVIYQAIPAKPLDCTVTDMH